MNVKVGILAADDSMNIILSVMASYQNFECVPIVYWMEDDVMDLVRQHNDKVDMWLFSGQVPYAITKNSMETDKPLFYIPHIGASLYKTLLQIAYKKRIPIENLSFDTFHPDELKRLFTETGLNVESFYLKSYKGPIDATELASYHEELFKQGKTKAAVTCLRSAQLELEKIGVPVYRVLPASSTIESVVSMMEKTEEMQLVRKSQIAVQMLELDPYSNLSKGSFSTDDLHNAEMKIWDKLYRYTKEIEGSLKHAGPGRYVIYTTRGVLQDLTNHFTTIPNLEDLEGPINKKVTCGIGIGKTAYEAEIHAGNALLHAREQKKGIWMVMFDDKTVRGPLGKQEQIEFGLHSQRLQEISEKTSLSIPTLTKLDSIVKKLGRNEINAHELAQYMQILPRSARRILTKLEEKGLAVLSGEETLSPRGRPRKIYRIQL
ncbi:hypothetical protein EV207_11734 [Scopulibacillus darangshiensis]|uniref:Transcriptional regulator n=1 Tax=Scopulibacillus darangshiensis TaxID=442528 RepID=A0A4R2P019_9BACL|nr:ArsR family transcriptional regulator [Scopulibacillus darangshiensis]TCP27807.1 hypothetical protein EV207_11734 [Scopulibacillus darangshiensis]